MKKTGAGGRGKNDVVDEVEMLLQSAHDELILKMSVDSHMSRVGASSNLDPDLHRRFQALKSQPSSSSPIPQDLNPKTNIGAASDDADDVKAVLGDDLAARFAALKSSIATPPALQGEVVAPNKPFDVREDDDDEDEVEKLIQWAMDAARLDPSPPSDSDADEKDEEEEDQIDSPPYSSSSDDEDLEDHKRKKEKTKKKDPTKSNK